MIGRIHQMTARVLIHNQLCLRKQCTRSISRQFSTESKFPSAVIFDLGGVVLASPFPAIRSFEIDVGIPEGSIFKAAAVAGNNGSFHRLERGELTLEDFIPEFTEELAAAGLKFKGLPVSELFDRMERSFVPIPEMITAIKSMRAEGIKTAALTNNWRRHSGVSLPPTLARELSPLFDTIVESCRCGLRKPDPRIYQRASEALRLPSLHGAVFLDDMGTNLKAARELGMRTIRVQPGPAGTRAAVAELTAALGGLPLDHFVPGTVSVRKAHWVDPAAISSFLAGTPLAEAGPVRHVRQFSHGQSNPTYHLLLAGGRELVLRKKPPGKILPGAHAVEREFAVLKALSAAGIPVPRPHALCDPPAQDGAPIKTAGLNADGLPAGAASPLGTSFYVMDYVSGQVHKDPALPGLLAAQRTAVYDAMAGVLAALHRVEPAAAGLASFGRPAGFYARQLATWSRQYEAAAADAPPAVAADRDVMPRLRDWLAAGVPSADAAAASAGHPSVVHGDFRLDNLVFAAARSGESNIERVAAILDWELATLGDSTADLAYNCLPYYLPPSFPQLGGLAGRALPEGVPSEEEYVRRYCRLAGRDGGVRDWHFYTAFAFFRVAAILEGVRARAARGNASSDRAAEVGRLAGAMAATGWKLSQQPRHILP